MKRWLLALPLVLGAALAHAAANPGYTPPPAETPANQPAGPKLSASVWDPEFRSGEGFQNLRWGMTVAEVRAECPDCAADGENLRRQVQLTQFPATERLLFAKARLVGVLVSYDVARKLDAQNPDAIFEPYMAARGGLLAKYGPATTAEIPALGSQPLIQIAHGVLQGIYTYDAIWDLPHTAIRLKAHGVSSAIRTTIAYGAKEYAPFSNTALDSARVVSERDAVVP